MRKVKVEDVEPLVRYANYFKLPANGQSWGPRTIAEYELIYIVAGEFSYETSESGKSARIAEGDVLCIPPGKEHVFRHVRSFAYGAVIACIHLELLRSGSRLAGDYAPVPEPPLVTRTGRSAPLHQLFRNCRDVFEG